jgi:hypothetical protein
MHACTQAVSPTDVRGCWVRITENSEVNFHPPESLLKDSIVEEFILLMGW